MLARLLRAILLTWLTAVVGWLVVGLAAGRPALAFGGAVALAAMHAAVLGLEFVLLGRINRDDSTPRASAGQRWRAWLDEVVTATRVFGWRQPWRSDVEPDHVPSLARRRGVVFVHGFMCNRGLWTPWLRRLRGDGVPFVAVNLEPVFGPIERYVPIVEAAVRRVERATGQAPLVVAHSMGGLAVRAWLQDHDADRRVHHVITVGSPHHGTALASLALAPNTRQMRRDSVWLARLAQAEPASRRAAFTCYYSHCDNIVMPASTARLDGADNRHVAGAAHVDLLFRPEIYAEVLRRLGDAQA